MLFRPGVGDGQDQYLSPPLFISCFCFYFFVVHRVLWTLRLISPTQAYPDARLAHFHFCTSWSTLLIDIRLSLFRRPAALRFSYRYILDSIASHNMVLLLNTKCSSTEGVCSEMAPSRDWHRSCTHSHSATRVLPPLALSEPTLDYRQHRPPPTWLQKHSE